MKRLRELCPTARLCFWKGTLHLAKSWFRGFCRERSRSGTRSGFLLVDHNCWSQHSC